MRTLGTLGMSVGTSLAFEADGTHIVKTHDNIIINLLTLIRNVLQSIEDDNKDIKELTAFVLEDIKLISKFVDSNRGAKPVQLIIYNPDYSKLSRTYKYGDLWVPTTVKQKAIANTTDKVLKAVLNRIGKLVKNVNFTVPTFSGKGVVITHHLVDLIDTPSGRLYLLESHTGSLKAFNAWHTKLTNGNKLFNMPLNRLTIQVFGDKSTNFKSQPYRIKQVVEELAARDKWTSNSSDARVRASINKHDVEIEKYHLLKMLG